MSMANSARPTARAPARQAGAGPTGTWVSTNGRGNCTPLVLAHVPVGLPRSARREPSRAARSYHPRAKDLRVPVSSMCWAVVKPLPQLTVNRSSVVAAEQTAHPMSGPRRRRVAPLRRAQRGHARSAVSAAARLAFYPSARAAARPPETIQSQAERWRRYPLRGGRRRRTLTNRTRRARGAARAAARRALQHRARRHDPCGRPAPERDQEFARKRDDADFARPFPVPKRARYQRVSALCGCQCTQLHASCTITDCSRVLPARLIP